MILDALTIFTSLCTVLWILENFLIYLFSWDVTWMWIKMAVYKRPGFIRRTADGNWNFQLATVDKALPKSWKLDMGKDKEGKPVILTYEVNRGGTGVGPMKTRLGLIADENSGASIVDLDKLLAGGSSGAQPSYVTAVEEVAYAKGVVTTLRKQEPKGTWEFIRANLTPIIVLSMIAMVITIVLYDKIWSSPGAWAATQTCQNEKAIILAKLAATGADISGIVQPAQSVTTTTLPMVSQVGGVIK